MAYGRSQAYSLTAPVAVRPTALPLCTFFSPCLFVLFYSIKRNGCTMAKHTQKGALLSTNQGLVHLRRGNAFSGETIWRCIWRLV